MTGVACTRDIARSETGVISPGNHAKRLEASSMTRESLYVFGVGDVNEPGTGMLPSPHCMTRTLLTGTPNDLERVPGEPR